MDKMVRYERKVHSCVRCGNIYTCISPAVCTFARETPDCPKCYQGRPYKQQEERARHMTLLLEPPSHLVVRLDRLID